MRDRPEKVKEALILYLEIWYIVRLGIICPPRDPVAPEPWWCQRDGSAVCKIGEESMLVDLGMLI